MLGVTLHTRFLLDTKPVPVMGYKRSKRHSDFAGSADYGVCVSRKERIEGAFNEMQNTGRNWVSP